jgi:hypothetical protein
VDEVAEERRGAGAATGGQAAPAVAGEGGTEEVGRGETAEDVVEVVLREGIDGRRSLRLYRRRGEEPRWRKMVFRFWLCICASGPLWGLGRVLQRDSR